MRLSSYTTQKFDFSFYFGFAQTKANEYIKQGKDYLKELGW